MTVAATYSETPQLSTLGPIAPDIWIYVAQFIPREDLCKMLDLNSTFFHLAMDARYYEATFTILDDPKTLTRIRRLRDPAIAHRVRRLHVAPNLDRGETWGDFFDGDMNPSRISHLLQENIQTMTDTVICLNNVVEFFLEWLEIPAKEDILPFLTAAMTTFGSGLRKVDFRVTFRYLSALLSVMNGLTALRHLVVDLCTSEFPETRDEDLLSTALAPFVNKVAPTLCTLSVFQSVDDLDMSKLFLHLTSIPNLRQFDLSYGRPVYLPPDLLSLTLFVRMHAATLRHIHWTTDYGADGMSEYASTNRLHPESPRGNELNGVIFPNLLTLRLPVPATPSSTSFDLIGQYIRRSAATLTSLELWDRYITFDQVNTLTSIFATRGAGHKLQELRFKVEYLSPELVQLLARVFPRLKKLAIVNDCVVAQNGMEQPLEPETYLAAREFANRMRECDIHDWPLDDVDILTLGESMMAVEGGVHVMCILAECVPSVKMFRGQDKHEFLAEFEPDAHFSI